MVEERQARLRDGPLGREMYRGTGSDAHKKASARLREKQRSARAQSAKLSFERKREVPEGSVRAHRPVQAAGAAVSRSIRAKASEHEQDNAGVEALNKTEETAAEGVRKVVSGHFGGKLHPHDKAGKLERRVGETSRSSPGGRSQQKQAIRKEYAAAKTGETTGTAATGHAAGFGRAAEGVGKAGKAAADAGKKTVSAVTHHPMALLIGGALAIVVLVTVSTISSCSAMASGGGPAILASSYTAADEEILGAEAAYCALEEGLRERIRNLEEDNPGYDAYEVHASEIGHDPYALAALLTVLHEDYTIEEVRGTLDAVFAAQYEYSTRVRSEVVEGTDETDESAGGTKRTLVVEVVNHSLNGAVVALGLTDDEVARYRLIAAQMGNRDYLFADNIYANPTIVLHYDIPGEALSDVRFARMVQEGEKYLGYPYVWGGSSPSTSFDCSGFVSWVINHSGNGWNVGRPA